MSQEDGTAAATAEQHEELLFPEVSLDAFTIDGRRFQIRQLPFTYERQVLKLLGPSLSQVIESPDGQWGRLLLDQFQELLPEIVAVIARVTDPSITAEWVADRVVARDMLSIVQRQLEKNKLMDLVADFFHRLRGVGLSGLPLFPSTPS